MNDALQLLKDFVVYDAPTMLLLVFGCVLLYQIVAFRSRRAERRCEAQARSPKNTKPMGKPAKVITMALMVLMWAITAVALILMFSCKTSFSSMYWGRLVTAMGFGLAALPIGCVAWWSGKISSPRKWAVVILVVYFMFDLQVFAHLQF